MIYNPVTQHIWTKQSIAILRVVATKFGEASYNTTLNKVTPHPVRHAAMKILLTLAICMITP